MLEKGFEEKTFDFITKPLSLNTLLQKIREILNRQGAPGPVPDAPDDQREGDQE
jgi:DNA-binding response OmpR family regulator